MVCMFLYWTENFLNRQVIASSVAKVLLEKIIPTWGTLIKLYSSRKPFTWPGISTSLYYLASIKSFSLCLQPSILWFSQTH